MVAVGQWIRESFDFLHDQKRPERYPPFPRRVLSHSNGKARSLGREKERERGGGDEGTVRSTVSHGRSASYPGGFISADFKVTVTRVSLCPTFVTSSICPCALLVTRFPVYLVGGWWNLKR